uniref:Uncharacterized protein n=1 Tax=Anguilla anguilla TaxID=7936 RepID=A0A0E9TU20_ANGAN
MLLVGYSCYTNTVGKLHKIIPKWNLSNEMCHYYIETLNILENGSPAL